jgi:APA family basic amino acid/polyamine antiporter
MEADSRQRAGVEHEGDDSIDSSAGEGKTQLARTIGPGLLLMFIVGDMLGGGIYALVGEVGAETGGAIWTSFLAAFILAALTAFAYAELVTKYPRAAGAALYTNKAFGIQFFTFMVAFAVMASGITSASTLARGFSGDSLSALIDSEVPVIPVSIAFLLLVAALNMRGIAESLKTNVVFTLIELTGLLLIVAVGIAAFGDGTADASRNFDFKDGESVFLAIVGGTTLAFYALIGFEDSVNLAEETKKPSVTYPKALFGGMLIVGVLYMAITFIASAVVPTETLAGSSAPLLQVVEIGPLGLPTKLFAAITLFALANGALINMIMASRLVYGMSNEGVVARFLGRVLPGRRTPWVAILFTTALGVILVSTGDLGDLADTTVFLLLCVFTIVNIAVLVLRKDEVEHKHFRAPWPLPVLGALVCAFLITQTQAEVIVRGGIILVVGAALYVISEIFRRQEKGGDGQIDAANLSG